MPVVHSGTPKLAIIDRESKRFHQVEPASCREAEPRDVARIRRNFGFNQHNVKHTSQKTKKAPQGPRRFFRREGISIAGLVGRTHLRRFDRFDVHTASAPVKTYKSVNES